MDYKAQKPSSARLVIQYPDGFSPFEPLIDVHDFEIVGESTGFDEIKQSYGWNS